MPLQTLRFNSSGPMPREVSETKQALDAALDELVPARQLDRNLLIGSWNIRGLGGYTPTWDTGPNDSPKRNLADLHYIAEVLSRFDIVAIQETKDNLEALRTIMSLLGPDWGLLMSDVTFGAKGNVERLGYVFDMRRVRPSGLAGELVLSPEDLQALRKVRQEKPFRSDDLTGKNPAQVAAILLESEFGGQLDRTPYIASFSSAGRPFMLATVHVVWGSRATSSAARRRRGCSPSCSSGRSRRRAAASPTRSARTCSRSATSTPRATATRSSAPWPSAAWSPPSRSRASGGRRRTARAPPARSPTTSSPGSRPRPTSRARCTSRSRTATRSPGTTTSSPTPRARTSASPTTTPCGWSCPCATADAQPSVSSGEAGSAECPRPLRRATPLAIAASATASATGSRDPAVEHARDDVVRVQLVRRDDAARSPARRRASSPR